MHLEEKAAQIVDLIARLGGCWSTLSTPPRYGPVMIKFYSTVLQCYITRICHWKTTIACDIIRLDSADACTATAITC